MKLCSNIHRQSKRCAYIRNTATARHALSKYSSCIYLGSHSYSSHTHLTSTQRNEVRQRPQQTRTQTAPASTKFRRPGYQDVRNFLYGATAVVTTAHATQTATEEAIAPTNKLIARCRAIRNRLQTPGSQAIQDTAEEPTNPLENAISRMRALRARFHTPRTQETQATMEEPNTSTDTTLSHLRAMRYRFRTARTQPSTTSTDTWRFFPGRNSSS
jgi:hypothetical protein